MTHDTTINRESVVTLLKNLAAQFTDLPIPLVLDNARYQRHADVMAEAARLEITWLWLPTYSPHRNLIARLGKLVQAHELYSEYWWCLWAARSDVWAIQTGDPRLFRSAAAPKPSSTRY
ncbi:MAG: transposase [Thermaerobacter sp.]|nr:transposase [Thermaerobacter sp.]